MRSPITNLNFVLQVTERINLSFSNEVFSVLVLLTKTVLKILKKIFVFQKICFKVIVLKTFKIFHIKIYASFKTEDYFENH